MGICLDTAAAPVVGPVYQPQLKSFNTTRLTTHLPHRGVKRPSACPYRPHGVVVYVLGGPGTGKVTLSEAVVQGSQGKLAHISMTKVLKDYAKHFDLAHGSSVPSSTAVEMLTARMKGSSARLGFVISGFPRNIDDAVECAQKISRLDGVILLDHRQEVLERLVQDGVQTGAITAESGEQELTEFLTHVLPLTELMNNKDVLYKINIADCDMHEIVNEMDSIIRKLIENSLSLHPDKNQNNESFKSFLEMDLRSDRAAVASSAALKAVLSPSASPRTSRPVLFVIGGPGSNKSSYCETVVPQYPGWTHLSCSWMLRDLVTDELVRDSPDVLAIRQLLVAGELVPQGLILSCLAKAMDQNKSSRGFIVSGFPRYLEQLEQFEQEHGRQSDVVLIDCSELELGRTLGRREDVDDTVQACRRRLELYRTVTLPAVRALDEAHRLQVIDGDCDEVQVVDQLKRCIYLELQRLVGHGPLSAAGPQLPSGAGRGQAWPEAPAGVDRAPLEVTEAGGGRPSDPTADGATPADSTPDRPPAATGVGAGTHEPQRLAEAVHGALSDMRRRSTGLSRPGAGREGGVMAEVDVGRPEMAR